MIGVMSGAAVTSVSRNALGNAVLGEHNTTEKFVNDALTSAAISGTVYIAGYGISAAYNYWNSIQPKSTITQNAGYVNPYGTGGRLGQDMAGATANSMPSGCDKVAVDYGNSNFSDIDSKLINGSSMKTDEVLDLASEFLGKGYTEPVSGSGRFVSQDGLRVFRMGDSDILGKHGGGPHVNFEYLEPNPLKPGKMQIIKDIHIYLED